MSANFQSLFSELRDFLPQNALLTDTADHVPYLKEWRDRFPGAADAVLLPENTEQVSVILRLCSKYGVKVTPQGGNTGLVGGQIPDPGNRGVILSLTRMNKIRRIAAQDHAIIVEAGVTVAQVQALADSVNLRFPFSIASEGSAQIGGVISTNAGGMNAVKHGLIEDLIIGLEAVTADGEIYHGLKTLRKDNQGFDVKRLFIGSEGIYGIVTAAALRTVPKPNADLYFAVALKNLRDVPEILSFLRNRAEETPEEFELIPKIGFVTVNEHKGLPVPFAEIPDYALLIRLCSVRSEAQLRQEAEGLTEFLYHRGLIADAVIPDSLRQMRELRNFREFLSECQKYTGGSIKHDVSVPVSETPGLIEQAIIAAKEILPDIRPFPFGHAGDGNIHLNFSAPVGMEKAEFMRYEDTLNSAIFAIVSALGGSFSAEHGVGRLRRKTLGLYGDPVANALRLRLKQTLDPQNILNPEKTLADYTE